MDFTETVLTFAIVIFATGMAGLGYVVWEGRKIDKLDRARKNR